MIFHSDTARRLKDFNQIRCLIELNIPKTEPLFQEQLERDKVLQNMSKIAHLSIDQGEYCLNIFCKTATLRCRDIISWVVLQLVVLKYISRYRILGKLYDWPFMRKSSRAEALFIFLKSPL